MISTEEAITAIIVLVVSTAIFFFLRKGSSSPKEKKNPVLFLHMTQEEKLAHAEAASQWLKNHTEALRLTNDEHDEERYWGEGEAEQRTKLFDRHNLLMTQLKSKLTAYLKQDNPASKLRYREASRAAMVIPLQLVVIDHLVQMLRHRILHPTDFILDTIEQPNPDDDTVRVKLTITGKALYDFIVELLTLIDDDVDDNASLYGLVCDAASVLFMHDVESVKAFEALIN